MISLLLESLSFESKMIAVLIVCFAASVAWTHKDKMLGLVKFIPSRKEVDRRASPHDLLDSYLMLIEKARADGNTAAESNLEDACCIIFEPYVKVKDE